MFAYLNLTFIGDTAHLLITTYVSEVIKKLVLTFIALFLFKSNYSIKKLD